MWNKLRTRYNITVPRDTVMRLLKEVDPVQSAYRKARKLQRRIYNSPGPNAAWHVDGHDKLKPYGFPIHGCIDGFSRKVLWLKVCRTNNNPIVPASYYLRTVEELGMCPELVQTDCGTENGILAGIQCTFLGNEKAHRYGASPSNQRIENWWSHNKRGFTTWVIDYFKCLVHEGKLLLGNHFHMECAWFVYANFLQRELDIVKEEWNTHYIRSSRNSQVSGVPDELFFLPQTRGYSIRGKQLSSNEINHILNQRNVHEEAQIVLNQEDFELVTYFKYVVANENLMYPPRDWNEARVIYETIIENARC